MFLHMSSACMLLKHSYFYLIYIINLFKFAFVFILVTFHIFWIVELSVSINFCNLDILFNSIIFNVILLLFPLFFVVPLLFFFVFLNLIIFAEFPNFSFLSLETYSLIIFATSWSSNVFIFFIFLVLLIFILFFFIFINYAHD